MWFEAGRQLGFETGDPNGFQKEGVYKLICDKRKRTDKIFQLFEGFVTFNMAINNGRRSSTYSEYVERWEKDPSNKGKLTVIRYANVSEVRSFSNLYIYLRNIVVFGDLDSFGRK